MIDTALILVLAVLLLLVAGGAGHYLLTRARITFAGRPEEACFSVVAGFGALILSVLVLGLAGLLYRPVVWGVVLVWLLVAARGLSGLRDLVRPLASLRPDPRSFEFWLVAAGVLGALLGLVRALAPPHGATDPLAYQLALPRLYLFKHFLSFEPTITGALYPANMNLLYLVGLALGDGSLAQVTHWLTGVLASVAIWVVGERHFGRSTGIWAGVLFSFTPVVVYFSPQAYIDVGLCYFQIMAFWALLDWVLEPSRRRLLLAGVLCGLAMGVKHQGLTSAAIGVVAVAGRLLQLRRGWRTSLHQAILFLAVGLLVVLPWYVRAYVCAGNPFWPLANGIFGGLSFREAPWLVAGGVVRGPDTVLGAILPSLEWIRRYAGSMSPWNWTFDPLPYGGMQKDIGVYFLALFPGLLVFRGARRQIGLLAFCLVYYLILVRFLHMNVRYGLVLLAVASISCGWVASQASACRVLLVSWGFRSVIAVSLAFNLLLAGLLVQSVVGVVVGSEARDSFLKRTVGNYRALEFINSHLPSASQVMFQGLVEGYYCERPYLWGDHPNSGMIAYDQYATPEQLLQCFRELRITHVLRIINLPPVRAAMYPDYFRDERQEAFRRRYLRPLYWDESYVLFQVVYP